ncbi:MAG: carboxypeptidase-like regulatory domain-containing protein, partial [Candidatus Methanoperedens sp.]|nr:carboxypeptidase-like regulatory domain-containing protein [Candidatus Methanoperedens sp.]
TNLGKFDVGKTIQYYSVANDTSGNTQQTSTYSFTVLDRTQPNISVSRSPIEPTDKDNVIIAINASDNGILGKVELYWNDGTWHNETWNSPSNPFSNSTNLGKFNVGKIIQYYSVANDTSGNTQQTSTYSFTILDRTQPNISVARSPIDPTDKDNVIIAINASDNDILGRVELYWNNGTLQSQTWFPNSNSLSLNYNIGAFENGTVVQYYAKAYDRSGNVNTTYTYSFTPTTLDTTPPASINNLKNISYAHNYINWTWTDPSDFDFDRVMVYIDGIFQKNISKGEQYYNATGLAPATYTIGTRTVDTNGNINTTMVTHMSTTILPSVRFINGTVMDSVNKTGIPGIKVSTNPSISTTTNASGFYSFSVTSGTYNIVATFEPTYYTNSSIVSTVLSAVVVHDIELEKKPTGTITGSATNV